MTPLRILVVGASGLVGTEVARLGAQRGHQVTGAARRIEGAARRTLDLSDRAAVERAAAELEPHVIFLCSAWPHVDGCEQDPERSERENVHTVANAVAAAR